MQPTVEAELSGARRVLLSLARGEEVSTDAAAQLNSVASTLGRLEKSWSAVLPWLIDDNAMLTALLDELVIDPEGRIELSALAGPATTAVDPSVLDPSAANTRNEALRALLVRALPAEGAARRQVIKLLHARLASRPW